MTKTDLIASVKEKAGLSSNAEATKVVEAVIESITEGINNDVRVAIKGFGTFKKETRNARKGINPATKQAIDIPAKDIVKFKASDSVLNK